MSFETLDLRELERVSILALAPFWPDLGCCSETPEPPHQDSVTMPGLRQISSGTVSFLSQVPCLSAFYGSLTPARRRGTEWVGPGGTK